MAQPIPSARARTSVPASAGIGLRPSHYQEILEQRPAAAAWFEVHSENYFGRGGEPLFFLEKIREDYPISLHGVGMSLGSTDALDRPHLQRLKRLVDRIEPGLVREITRDDLEQSSASILARFLALMQEALAQAAVAADVIFVTGGTARSPTVQAWLRRHFPDARIVQGDSFGSVASGLALQAARKFGPGGLA